MGAFDKFRKANKLFWDSSKRKIDKIPDTYTNRKSQYIEVLNRYYTEYTIDIFDEENINRLFEFYPLVPNGITTHSQVYNDLKEIQRNSEDYVIDYVSYKERLKAYYDIHGKDTEWLVKIFAERYDLDRFNITTKEVLDDLHEIISTVTEPSSLKNNSSLTNDEGDTDETENEDFWKREFSGIELRELIDLTRIFYITEEQLNNNKEVILETPQGNIAYRLSATMNLNKVYRFKNKGETNPFDIKICGDLYAKFKIKSEPNVHKTDDICNKGGLSKTQATASFTLGRYFDVINILKEAPPTDFNIIVLTSQSHLAVGNLVSAYNTLKILFESNEPIYQLPYTDKKKSFPLGYEIFEILKSLQINTWSDALKREKLFPVMPTELGKIKNVNHNEFGENCYYQISELSADIKEISMKECIDALVKAEMAIELSWNIDKRHYQLKAMYLERLLSYFSNEPVDDVMDLWARGLNDCLRMAK